MFQEHEHLHQRERKINAKEAEAIIDQTKVKAKDSSVAWNIKQRQKIEKLIMKTRRKAGNQTYKLRSRWKNFRQIFNTSFFSEENFFSLGQVNGQKRQTT